MIDINDITTDPDIQTVLRPQTDDERSSLVADIKQHGFRCPLVVWLNYNILLDGHQRLDIHHNEFGSDPDREPETVEYTFPDKAAAIAWVKRNQCARRNLTKEEVRMLRASDYVEQRQAVGAPKGNKNRSQKQQPQDAVIESTADKVGRKHGVSGDTILRDAKWLDSVEAINEKIGPEAEQRIMSGELKPTDADLHAIANLDNPTMADLEAADKARRERRRRASKPAVEQSKPVSDDASADDFLRDAAKDFARVRKQFNAGVRPLLELNDTLQGRFITKQLINRCVKKIRDELKRAVPAKECGKCKTRGCLACGNLGFVPASYED